MDLKSKATPPILSPCFAAATLLVSTTVAYLTVGQPFATVNSRLLLHAGAINGKLLHNFEVWRLLTAQLVHVKQLHMILNVLFCLFLGNSLKRNLGRWRFALIYWLGGTLGILASVASSPLNVASGASQAMLALCGAAVCTNVLGEFEVSKGIVKLAYTATLIQLALDLYAVQLPKAGHVVAFFSGGLLTLTFSKTRKGSSRPSGQRYI